MKARELEIQFVHQYMQGLGSQAGRGDYMTEALPEAALCPHGACSVLRR